MRITHFLALTPLIFARLAQAQVCLPADTFDTCGVKLGTKSSIPEKPSDAALAADARAELATKNTGDTRSTSINDFLPLVQALLDTGGLSNNDGEKLGVEWSNPLRLPSENQNKLMVSLERSGVYEPLKDALRAGGLENQISALEDKIDEGDDVLIGFSYARASERYGRDPEMHRPLFSDLLAAADELDPKTIAIELSRRTFMNDKGITTAQAKGPFTLITDQTVQSQYIRLTEQEILARIEYLKALRARLEDSGFYTLLDLINNQPQLSFTATYRDRDEMLGPDAFSAIISYEMGLANVNDYRKRERCQDEDTAQCLKAYLARPDVIANLKESRRLSFKAEYTELQRLNFTLPGTTPFAFSAEPAERLAVTGAISRYLGEELAGRRRSRLDASISYEDFSDDPSRQDRGLATATLTYPISEGFFFSVGAVYATKPEFRGDVDKELSARAGLTYKIAEGK